MLEAGQVIATWELVRKLGEGAFGQVWLARHVALGDERALKVPTDPDYVAQLRKEGQLQHQLDHPNIVKTFDLNPLHDPPYAVMEYVEGESLRERLNREGTLSVDEALRILGQVLEAVQAAHAAGVLHRDLKPENVLLAADGTVKVTDFGISKVQPDVLRTFLRAYYGGGPTAGRSVAGTLDYMSPEQRSGQEPTPSDDLYAVGVMACELLAGQRPGAHVDRTLKRAGTPQEVVVIIDRACEERDYRYPHAAEMLADVRAAAATTRAEPGNPPSPARPTRPAFPSAPAPPTHTSQDLITNSIGMTLKVIEPGTFIMGSARGYDGERPAHEVALSHGFHLGIYPVTQAEYERVVGWNPSRLKGPKRPVEQVSWDDARAFCRKLSVSEGVEYRLPTEAEWEFACRAGTTTEYCFGDDEDRLTEYAWFDGNSNRTTHDVGQKKANAWGIHDILGNAWEWCQSLYKPYPYRADDGREDLGAEGRRVLRGGSWFNYANCCRSALRSYFAPAFRFILISFRVARPLR